MCSDECRAKGLDRREFVAESAAALIALGGLGSPVRGQDEEQPPTRVLDDPTIEHGKVVFKHNGRDTIDGYLARPKAEGAYLGVLVIAGNVITEEYIPNTCAALALAGFVGLAPNIFHPIPEGTPNTNDAYAQYIAEHTDLDRLDDVQLGASYLRAQPFVDPGESARLGRPAKEAGVQTFHPAAVRVTRFPEAFIRGQDAHQESLGRADRADTHRGEPLEHVQPILDFLSRRPASQVAPIDFLNQVLAVLRAVQDGEYDARSRRSSASPRPRCASTTGSRAS